jgi:hypothetical protein
MIRRGDEEPQMDEKMRENVLHNAALLDQLRERLRFAKGAASSWRAIAFRCYWIPNPISWSSRPWPPSGCTTMPARPPAW